MMLACDKNGGDRSVFPGGMSSFGGNHGGRDGNVLRVDGSVRTCLALNWANPAPNGRGKILGGIDLGVCAVPSSLAGR